MKRLFAILILALALMPSARAETVGYYINNNIVVAPPLPVPTVDATNFVNQNWFQINAFSGDLPYDFSNVQNFTNKNFMYSAYGFRFDTASSSAGFRKRAKNFSNAGLIPSSGDASIEAGVKLEINASNIVNRGLLLISGSQGYMSLKGDNIDGDRGVFQVGPAANNNASGLYDNYWGIGTNRIVPAANLTATAPFTPTHGVTILSGNTYITNVPAAILLAPPGLTSVVSETTAGTNRTVQIVFLYNANPSISNTVRFFGNTAFDLGAPVVEWQALSTNPVTGAVFNNRLYLTDSLSLIDTNTYVTNYPNGLPPPTAIPENYSFTRTFPGFSSGAEGATYTTPGADYWGTNAITIITNAQYAAYSVRLSPLTYEPSLGLAGSTVAKLAERLDIDADRQLSLSLAQINVPNYVRINSTNHFVGATNASISAVFADIWLGNTNGMLNTRNVLLPTIPRFTGRIDLYSALWTNSVFLTPDSTNASQVLYQVLFVNSQLQHLIEPQVVELVLRSTNVLISDKFNIFSNLVVAADNLTISPSGILNMTSPYENWAKGVPHLKNFTNEGYISSPNSLYFLGAGKALDGSDLPYLSFVNRGVIDTAGNTISSAYVENRGFIYAGYGAIDINGTDVSLLAATTTNLAILYAPFSDILINASNLTISNQTISPGRALSLWVTGNIKDGGPAFTNRITTGDGFNLFVKPATGDLLTTVITNNASTAQTVPNWWAGEDRGVTSAGFVNNAALGKMVLNGGTNSFYIFYPAGNNNALYVGTLELRGGAAQTNAAGVFTGMGIAPGMKIYYTYLQINGVSVSPSLINGQSDGRFNYVSSYTGPEITSLVSESGPTVYDFNLDLGVSSGNPPGSAVLVSWNTVAGANNRVYYKDGLADSQWHLLGSFVSSADGRVEYPDAVSGSGRVYKVELDLPTP